MQAIGILPVPLPVTPTKLGTKKEGNKRISGLEEIIFNGRMELNGTNAWEFDALILRQRGSKLQRIAESYIFAPHVAPRASERVASKKTNTCSEETKAAGVFSERCMKLATVAFD